MPTRTEQAMTSDDQLALWLRGESVHNADRGECCPDFSCCKPELLAPKDEREAFVKLGEKGRMGLLGAFLGRAIELAGKGEKIYVIGDPLNYLEPTNVAD